jgi:hypothetical protein
LGYVQAGADHQRKFDIQWQEYHKKQHEKFAPKVAINAVASPRIPLTEITPPPLSALPMMECEFSREKPKVTPATAAAEQRIEERLECFQDFQIFLKRAQSQGKSDSELVRTFLQFQRFERLKNDVECDE